MNLVDLIRLYLRHKYLLLATPIILMACVFVLTRNSPKKYTSNTSLYTGITSGYNIENQEGGRIDFFRTRNAFDNLINIIKSEATLEEVSLLLFTAHLHISDTSKWYLTPEHFRKFQELLTEEVKALKGKTPEETFENLNNYKSEQKDNFIYNILHYKHPHYSYKALSGMKVKKIDESDLIEITYESDDPGVCKLSLQLLTQVFSRKHKELLQNQSNSVHEYFERQLRAVADKLAKAEDELLTFNKNNSIINYYEQTKFVADKFEKLEVEYQQERMALVAADSALKEIETRLGIKEKIFLKSDLIINRRNRLSELSSQISYLEGTGPDSLADQKTKELRKQVDLLKSQLKNDLGNLYEIKHTTQGVNYTSILEKWLENTIYFSESNARLSILEERRSNFLERYKLFAPLGAQLKKIEREIDVYEREYLSVLYGLNLSKLKQQNLDMSSNIQVIDPPYFPIDAVASNKKLILIAAGIAGLIFVMVLLFFMEYFDSTLNNPHKAKEDSQLEIAGIFPLMKGKTKVEVPTVLNLLADLIVQKILQEKEETNDMKPFLISISSPLEKEGKTDVAEKLSTALRKYESKLMHISIRNDEQEAKANMFYCQQNDILSATHIEDFFRNKFAQLLSEPAIVVLEIPTLLHRSFRLKLLQECHMNLMIARANRRWTKADQNVSELIKDAKNRKPFLILNGVELHVCETLLGDLPKKRNKLQRLIKRWLLLEFHS